MTSATEILPQPSSRKQAELAVKWSNVLQCLCMQRYYRGEKKEKKGKLVKCRTADKTKQKKFWGVHGAHGTRTMPDPQSWSINCDRHATRRAQKKDDPQWFLPVFQATSPTRRTEHIWCPYRGIIGTDFDSELIIVGQDEDSAFMLPTQFFSWFQLTLFPICTIFF